MTGRAVDDIEENGNEIVEDDEGAVEDEPGPLNAPVVWSAVPVSRLGVIILLGGWPSVMYWMYAGGPPTG